MSCSWETSSLERCAHLFRRVFVFRQLHHLTRHLVNGSDDLQHLVFGYRAVRVDVVELQEVASSVPLHTGMGDKTD